MKQSLVYSAVIATMISSVAHAQESKTREERIKEHQARIEKIIQENKKKQEEEAKKAQERAKAAAPATAPAGVSQAAAGAAAAPGTTPQPGAPLPAGPVTQYNPAAPGTSPGKGQPAAAAAPAAARSEARSMVYLKPFDSVVNIGETFATDIVADTKNGATDKVAFRLKYPKGVLNPLAIDHSFLDPYVKDQIKYQVNEDDSEIYLEAELSEPSRLISKPMLRVYWEAVNATSGAQISFEFGDTLSTGLFLDDSNFLGTALSANDGVINGTVMVRNPKAKTVVRQVREKDLFIGSSAHHVARRNMSLELQIKNGAVRQGEEFTVSVILHNPDNSPIDRVRLYLQFEPQDVEVVDHDSGNWIRRGINIQDGFAHKEFPFDFHKTNLADNEAGIVLYDEASEITPIAGSGELARIRFKAKRAIDRTDIVLVANGAEPELDTDVQLMHTSTLRNRPEKLAAVDGVVVSIVPRQSQIQVSSNR